MKDQAILTTSERAELAARIESELAQHTGSETFIRHGLCRKLLFTEGVQHMRDLCNAYWLVDAIASHQTSREYRKLAEKDQRLEYMAIWTLRILPADELKGLSRPAVLECWADTGDDEKPVITQNIEYTDFPLEEIKFYANLYTETEFMLMLPREY